MNIEELARIVDDTRCPVGSDRMTIARTIARAVALKVLEEAAKQPRLAWADGWGPKPPEDGAAEGALIVDCERRIRSLSESLR